MHQKNDTEQLLETINT